METSRVVVDRLRFRLRLGLRLGTLPPPQKRYTPQSPQPPFPPLTCPRLPRIHFPLLWYGAWLSLVERLNGVQKVAGSNPVAPTILRSPLRCELRMASHVRSERSDERSAHGQAPPVAHKTAVAFSVLVRFFPLFKAVVVPARHAYSHCASVGRSSVPSPVFARSFPMNDPASTAALPRSPARPSPPIAANSLPPPLVPTGISRAPRISVQLGREVNASGKLTADLGAGQGGGRMDQSGNPPRGLLGKP